MQQREETSLQVTWSIPDNMNFEVTIKKEIWDYTFWSCNALHSKIFTKKLFHPVFGCGWYTKLQGGAESPIVLPIVLKGSVQWHAWTWACFTLLSQWRQPLACACAPLPHQSSDDQQVLEQGDQHCSRLHTSPQGVWMKQEMRLDTELMTRGSGNKEFDVGIRDHDRRRWGTLEETTSL